MLEYTHCKINNLTIWTLSMFYQNHCFAYLFLDWDVWSLELQGLRGLLSLGVWLIQIHFLTFLIQLYYAYVARHTLILKPRCLGYCIYPGRLSSLFFPNVLPSTCVLAKTPRHIFPQSRSSEECIILLASFYRSKLQSIQKPVWLWCAFTWSLACIAY